MINISNIIIMPIHISFISQEFIQEVEYEEIVLRTRMS